MDARELEALILEQGVMIDDMQRHLRQISKDLDEVLELVRPVSDHAQWVDHLRPVEPLEERAPLDTH